MAGFYYLLNNTGIEYITIQWESICKYYKNTEDKAVTLTIILNPLFFTCSIVFQCWQKVEKG